MDVPSSRVSSGVGSGYNSDSDVALTSINLKSEKETDPLLLNQNRPTGVELHWSTTVRSALQKNGPFVLGTTAAGAASFAVAATIAYYTPPGILSSPPVIVWTLAVAGTAFCAGLVTDKAKDWCNGDSTWMA